MPLVSFPIDTGTLEALDFLVKQRGRTRAELIGKVVREYVAREMHDNRVIQMNARAFDAFLESLDEKPDQGELQGRRRLRTLSYAWERAR